MKQFLAMTAGLLMAGATLEAHADCEFLHEYSTYMMNARQHGIAMPRAMATTQDSELLKEVVMQAYREPRFSTDEYRQQAIEDFANEVFRQCMEHMQTN